MKYSEIFDKVSLETNIPKEVVAKAYKSYWLFIKETIESLPLKEDLTEDEFLKLKTNFNLPSLGKLSCSLDRYKGVKKHFKYSLNDYNKKD